jgi:site-specific DNA recombinase
VGAQIAVVVGFIAMMIGASGVFVELRDTLNYIWNAPQDSSQGVWSIIRDRFLSFAMVIGAGFLRTASLAAQLELRREFARREKMVVLQEFIDVESAGTSGRTGFGQMLAFLKKNQSRCRNILVEKTDRLYRNISDYSKVGDSGVTVDFVKEGTTLSPDSRSSDQFMHGIRVLMARNYSQNLGEETHKGMLQKARSGFYPSYAPAGYRNVEGPDQRRVIVPDSDAPTVTRLFEEFATGRYSLKTLAAKCRAEGWTIRSRRVVKSTLHQILRKRIYTGDFDWDGVTYPGRHEALVSRETWDRVQTLIDKRVETRQHRIRHDFTFTGFVRCGHCGCQLVGELKKGRYVYYHCTGHHGKCAEPYTREEVMQDQLAASLRELVVPREILAWLNETVSESDLTERAARERETTRLEEQRRRLDSKLDAMYEDRLEGRITPEMYDRKASELRGQSLSLSRRIEEIRAAAPAPVQDAIDLMDLTSRAADLFAVQPVHEKQGFLRLILKSATWRQGRLQTEFEQPFENMRHSNRLSRCKEKEIVSMPDKKEIWLPERDITRNGK